MSTITLSQLYGNLNDIPEDEALYNYIDPEADADFQFPIKIIPWNMIPKLLTPNGDISVVDAFEEFSSNEGKELADTYADYFRDKHFKDNKDIIVIKGNKVIDGNHRLIGAFKAKSDIRAIDLNNL